MIYCTAGGLAGVFFLFQVQGLDRETGTYFISPFNEEVQLTISFDELRQIDGASYELQQRCVCE